MIATSVRPTASPEPFSVCTSSGLPLAGLRQRACMRRAWKSSKLLHEEISRYLFCPGSHTSMSYVLAAAKPMSPVHSVTTRYGNSSCCKIFRSEEHTSELQSQFQLVC